MTVKDNKIFLLYKILPKRIRRNFLIAYSKVINLSFERFYRKIRENYFTPSEQAIISYHLGLPQDLLFDNIIVEISEDYRKNIEPLYKDFFPSNGFEYDPKHIAKLLTNTEIIITE